MVRPPPVNAWLHYKVESWARLSPPKGTSPPVPQYQPKRLPVERALAMPSPWYEPNPNWLRSQPATKPAPEPALSPETEIEEWQFEVPSQKTETLTRYRRLPSIRPRPHQRRKPEPGVGEGKAKGWKNIGVMLFKALDSASERAEIVDAIFDALPKDVKARWSKDRPNRGLLDNAGQYGIDGADWKAQAIYHNMHRLDVAQAIRNIVKNYLSDKVHGAMHRRLPVIMGRASDPGSKAVSDFLDQIFKEMGL